jgi:DNA uptake protein ComE-like DNA-binding protein
MKINPVASILHLTSMPAKVFLAVVVCSCTLFLTGCIGCNTKSPTPDEVRQKTAEATAELKDNAKAVAQGVKEGLTRPSSDHPINLNSATKSQLTSLPGITDDAADRIIAGRPYTSEHELLDRRIISREEYNKIADSVTVKK